MPQTLAIIVAETLADIGVGAATAAAIGNAILAGGWALIATAASLVAGALAGGAPSLPKPADGKQAKRQPVPPRISGFGRVRVGGYYMCFEESNGVSYDVVALHDGEIDAIEGYFLTEDEVTLSGGYVVAGSDGRYGTNQIQIDTRLGLPTETAYSPLVSGLSSIWTSDHRGDGIASMMMVCGKVAAEDYLKIYPSQLPTPSVIARLQKCWDPRDDGQSYSDASTWTWTKNPVLHLLHYITQPNGMDQDVVIRIVPEIDSWRAAADICEQGVDLAAGGVEARYECGGLYQHDNDPAEVIAAILSTFDGWLGETGTGALRVYAGQFYTPTVSITAKHITGFRVQRFTPDEQAVNQIDFSYTSPSHRYSEVQGESWLDDDDISARGKTRAKNVSLIWAQSHSQCRRLVKREMKRLTSDAQGSIQTDLYGLTLLGERYINLTIPDLPSLGTFAVQISNAQIDLSARQLSFDWVKVDSSIDDWDPETEEGTPPPDLDDAPSTGSDSAITASPTNVQAAGASGHTTVTWRNPASYNFSYAKVFRATTTNFADASDISGSITGGLSADMSYQDNHAAGTFRYWVVAYTAVGEASAPTGPATATIT